MKLRTDIISGCYTLCLRPEEMLGRAWNRLDSLGAGKCATSLDCRRSGSPDIGVAWLVPETASGRCGCRARAATPATPCPCHGAAIRGCGHVSSRGTRSRTMRYRSCWGMVAKDWRRERQKNLEMCPLKLVALSCPVNRLLRYLGLGLLAQVLACAGVNGWSV